jgi:hypothetical protein
MRLKLPLLLAGLLPLATLSLTGCSDPYAGRYGVVGEVKLKGQALSHATVSFEPIEKQDTRASATVDDGKYTIPRESGLQPGRYLIRVSAGDGVTAINPVDENNPPGPTGSRNIISKDLVPRDWNVDSKQERTITKDSPNKVDFDIP